jgi:predicted Zn-dependent peptidase
MSSDTIRVTRLDNGLTIATDTMGSVQTATVGLWNNVGARHETKANNGVAHFLEHMVFKGTKTRSVTDIAKTIENAGGYLNAYTSNENTAYYARMMADDVALGLDVVSDLLLNPTFPEPELERERGVVLQEIGMYQDNPDSLVFHNAQSQAYGDTPLGRPILGFSDTIKNMPRQTLVDFIQDYYTPSTMVLAGAGALNHDSLVKQAEKLFANVKPKAKPKFESAIYQGGDIRQDKNDLEQVHLVLNFPAPDYYHEDYYTAAVLGSILGDGMSSRLFQEIREKRGLVYSVYSYIESYADSGQFGVYAGTGPELVTELIPVLCDSLRSATGSFTPEEINRAKIQFRAQKLMALESTSKRCEKLAQNILKFNRPISMEETLAKIDAVNAEKLDKLAHEIFSGKPTFSALGPLGKLESYDSICARMKA